MIASLKNFFGSYKFQGFHVTITAKEVIHKCSLKKLLFEAFSQNQPKHCEWEFF